VKQNPIVVLLDSILRLSKRIPIFAFIYKKLVEEKARENYSKLKGNILISFKDFKILEENLASCIDVYGICKKECG